MDLGARVAFEMAEVEVMRRVGRRRRLVRGFEGLMILVGDVGGTVGCGRWSCGCRW